MQPAQELRDLGTAAGFTNKDPDGEKIKAEKLEMTTVTLAPGANAFDAQGGGQASTMAFLKSGEDQWFQKVGQRREPGPYDMRAPVRMR